MGFAFAAAMDNDKRLLPPIVAYCDAAEISGNEVSRRMNHEKDECDFLIPPRHSCLIHSRRVCELVVVRGGGKSEELVSKYQSMLILGCKRRKNSGATKGNRLTHTTLSIKWGLFNTGRRTGYRLL